MRHSHTFLIRAAVDAAVATPWIEARPLSHRSSVILKALARPLSPGEIPNPPSSIDILSVGHHARESALVVGQPDAPPLQLLPKAAGLLHEALDDLLLVAVDPCC